MFTVYDVEGCLYDERRVEMFSAAISATVRPGDVVVDGGSGTGILGLLAARAGAARVYCVEIGEDFLPVIEENARRNGLADRVIAVHGDATRTVLPEPVDVIITELISGGFFYEPQLQVIDNMLAFLKPGGSIIPSGMTNYLELIAAQETVYGLNLGYDTRHRNLAGDVRLTERSDYLRTDFAVRNGFTVSAEAEVRALRGGAANAVQVTYDVDLTGALRLVDKTDFLLNPQILFLEEAVPVAAGERYRVSLDYESAGNPLDCRITVKACPA